MRYLAILIACLLPVLVTGQEPPFNFLHFGTEEGLSSNSFVTGGAITQDQQGYLWIGTANGLNRYDGTTFKHYVENPTDSNAIRGSVITALYTDHEGMIWVGTQREGLSRIDPRQNEIRHFSDTSLDPAPQLHVTAIFEDRLNRLWIAESGKGLFLFDRDAESFQLVHLEHDQNELITRNYFQHMVTGQVFDPADSTYMWLSTVAGLCKFNTSTLEAQFFLTDSLGCRRMHYDGAGNLWYTTWGMGLLRFNLEAQEYSIFYYDDPELNPDGRLHAADITSMPDGTLLLASTRLGLVMFNPIEAAFKMVSSIPHQQMAPGRPARFFWDRDENLWISTLDEGLYCLQKQRQLYRQIPVEGSVSKLAQHPHSGEVFAAVDDAPVLYAISPTMTTTRIDIDTTYHPGGFPSLAIDSAGRVWLLAWRDLYKYDWRSQKATPVRWPAWNKGKAEFGYYWDCLVDADNALWITAQGHGLGQLDLTKRSFTLHTYRDDDARSYVRNYSVSHISEDSQGRIWTCSRSGFNYYAKESGDFVNYPSPLETTDGGDAFNRVCAVTEDRNGYIWIAEYLNRVGRIDPAQPTDVPAKIMTATSSLPNALVYDMLSDADGVIWLASAAGLTKLSPPYERAAHFGQAYGIGAVKDLVLTHEGILLAAQQNRVLWIDPAELVPVDLSPEAVITTFNVFDKAYQGIADPAYLQEAQLTHKQNFFSFEYSAIDFLDEGPREFAYMLDGLDENWINAGSRQYASYTNIGGGRYTFRVRVRDAQGGWSDRHASLPIVVTPPVYGRWWFWPLVICFSVLLVYLVYRWRVAQIHKAEALKTAFHKQLAEVEMKALRAQMNPHFLFNSLNAIKYYVLKKDRHLAADYLNDFSKLIRLVLQNSAEKLITLTREIEALKLYVQIESLRFDKQFEYVVDIENGVDAESTLVPPLIFQPYVENAIWHGLMHKTDGKGMLKIHLAKFNGHIQCTIEDNGIGRKKAAEVKSKSAEKRKSMGMQITRHRMNMNSALNDMAFSVEVEDLYGDNNEAAGTRVEISFQEKKAQTSQS